MNKRAVTALALFAVAILALGSIALAADGPNLEASVRLTSHLCTPTSGIHAITIYTRNHEPFLDVNVAPRSQLANTFVVDTIDLDESVNGTAVATFHLTPTDPDFMVARWDRLVLPGETAAVLYFGWGCSAAEAGQNVLRISVHGSFAGEPVTLGTRAEFTVSLSD